VKVSVSLAALFSVNENTVPAGRPGHPAGWTPGGAIDCLLQMIDFATAERLTRI
jgi:hypothetical protein